MKKTRKERIVYNQARELGIKEKVNWLLAALVVVLAVSSILLYAHKNSQKVDEQREYELIRVSRHTSHYFEDFLENKLEWMRLFAVATSLSDYVDKTDWRELLKTQHTEDSQMGIANTSGTLYYGENEKKNVKDREYFQHSMNGEDYISKLYKDKLHRKDSIILSVPIENLQGKTEGVLAVEYSTLKLGEYLNNINDEWDKYGANMVINDKGELVASYEGMEKYDTIYDALGKMEFKDGDSLKKMKMDVRNDKAGTLRYYNSRGLRRMVYYQPLDVNDWTMVSIGAMKYNMTTLQAIEQSNLIFSVVFALLILLAVFAARNIFVLRTQKIKSTKRDDLTKIYKREVGEGVVKTIFEHPEHTKIYGCMFIDVDDFKKINDTYGHSKGDEALALLGEILLSGARKEDIIYRYGGDEFCIWLYGNGAKKEVVEIGNRIQHNANERGDIKLSIGATVVEKTEKDLHAVLKRADTALYEAKERGKNQLVLYEDMDNQ